MSQTKRTTKDAAEIFDGFVDTLKTIVTEGEILADEDGKAVRKTPSPATLNVIRQFLRDQNISATPEHAGLASLARASSTALPFEVDDEGNERPSLQ